MVACVAAGCVTKSRYSPSAQRLPKACSDTPRMDTRIFVSISDWLVSYAPYDWSYSCKILKYKYCHALLIRQGIVIYAVGSSKRETRDGKFGNIFAIDRKQVRLQKLCCKTEKTSITYRANRKIGSRTEKP